MPAHKQDSGSLVSPSRIGRLTVAGLILVGVGVFFAAWSGEVEKRPECSSGNTCESEVMAYFVVSITTSFIGVLVLLAPLGK